MASQDIAQASVAKAFSVPYGHCVA